MKKIRLLIVDDEVVIRRLFSNSLSHIPFLEIIGSAPNGKLALRKVSQTLPDLVILDIQMADGLETFKEIRKHRPDLPIFLATDSLDEMTGRTLELKGMGAFDFITKPANYKNKEEGAVEFRKEVLPKIKLLFPDLPRFEPYIDSEPLERTADLGGGSPISRIRPRLKVPQRIDVLAIGVSTGGPNALSQLIPDLPDDIPVPFLIVQHMPSEFTALLANRLSEKSAFTVTEATSGEKLEPGRGWVAPGDKHLALKKLGDSVQLALHQGPQENSCRPSVDVLFRSVAEIYGSHSLAVVLTGMGQDGLRGCEHIFEAGGQIIAQDESSSVVWGMPGYVAKAGLADKVLPLEEIGFEIKRRISYGRPRPTKISLKN